MITKTQLLIMSYLLLFFGCTDENVQESRNYSYEKKELIIAPRKLEVEETKVYALESKQELVIQKNETFSSNTSTQPAITPTPIVVAPRQELEAPITNHTYTSKNNYYPHVAENGDVKGRDNDGDGRAEPVHVKGYYRKDGTYVRGHYRAAPRKKK